MSAAPSAMRQNLIDESIGSRWWNWYCAASESAVSTFIVWLISASASPVQARGRIGSNGPRPWRLTTPDGVVTQLAVGRGRHHARDRHSLVDQADVDGEVRIAAHERLGAVQRVDQEKAWPDRVGRAELAGVFLRNHRHAGEQPLKSGQDQSLAALVGFGHRALIGLGGDHQPGLPQRQDQPGGGGGQIDKIRGDIGGCDVQSHRASMTHGARFPKRQIRRSCPG